MKIGIRLAGGRMSRTVTTVVVAALVAGLMALPSTSLARTDPRSAPVSDQFAADLRSLAPTEPYGAFVHFAQGGNMDRERILAEHQLVPTTTFESVDVVYAVGLLRDFAAVRREPGVVYLETDRELRYYGGDTAPWASRVRVAHEPAGGGPYFDPAGNVLDGQGVGVAVVDTGIDATHPDLRGRVAKNYKVVCTAPRLLTTQPEGCSGILSFQQVPNSDSSSGHGTHVAGIVAGDGTSSAGTYRGTAPGATLYGFGVGEATTILTASSAFEFILQNFESFNPRIRVINNSYGDAPGTAYDPNSLFSKLVRQLVDNGITVVFAAGNDYGNGSKDRTSSLCKDPTPGVICVANYNDAKASWDGYRCLVGEVGEFSPYDCTPGGGEVLFGSADRNNRLHGSSSRGRTGEPQTYPDISVPGTDINSTCSPQQPICESQLPGKISIWGFAHYRWAPWYTVLTGTSMAAPHLSGAIALLKQARPAASPAELEDIVLDSAHKFNFQPNGTYFDTGAPYEPDPQNEGSSTSVDKGAGLLDLWAALEQWGVSGTGLPGSQPRTIIEDVSEPGGPGAADVLGMSLSEVSDGVRHSGVRYTVRVRDVEDVPRGPNGAGYVTLQLNQMVDGYGLLFTTPVLVFRDHVEPVRYTGMRKMWNTAPAVQVKRDVDADTISFLLPYSHLGNPAPGAPVHSVFIGSSVGPFANPHVFDLAPGGTGIDAYLRPRYGTPYSVVRAPEKASADFQWDASGYPRPGRLHQVPGTTSFNPYWSPPTPAISADGRYVALPTDALSRGRLNIVVYDERAGATHVASPGLGGVPANADSHTVAMTPNGRFVTFVSRASNLVEGDTNNAPDVFVHDRDADGNGQFDETGGVSIERVTVAADGRGLQEKDRIYGRPSITPDGRYVVFSSDSSSLVANDTNGASDVFLHDRTSGEIELVSVSSDEQEGKGLSASSGLPSSISSDGRYVAFFSSAPNLVAGDGNGDPKNFTGFDVFVRDRAEGTTMRVSLSNDGREMPSYNYGSGGGAFYSSITPDGRYVAFATLGWGLVPEDSNAGDDVFVRDRDADADGIMDEPGAVTTRRVSVASDGTQSDQVDAPVVYTRAQSAWFDPPAISATGRYVSFDSRASNLVPGDHNGDSDMFVHDQVTATTERISLLENDVENDTGTFGAMLSGDGRYVTFGMNTPRRTISWDYHAVGGYDRVIFVRDRGPELGASGLTRSGDATAFEISGRATFSGVVLAAKKDPRDAALEDVDLTRADVVYRAEHEDILARLQVAKLPSYSMQRYGANTSAVPGRMYGFGWTTGGTRYEIRATVPLGEFSRYATGVRSSRFELFECPSTCTKIAEAMGSLGTVGDEVWLNVPTTAFGAAEGDAMTDLEAFTAAEAREVVLDTVELPDVTLPSKTLEVGLATSGETEANVVFEDASGLLDRGRFTWRLPDLTGSDLSRGWVRTCLGSRCSASSIALFDEEPDPELSPTTSPSPDESVTVAPSPSITVAPEPTKPRGTYPETPNDPYFAPGKNILLGAGRYGTQWGPQKIQAPQAWQEHRATGYEVKVAVLDTGVDVDHPDLNCVGKLDVVSGSDVVDDDGNPDDEHGHGTHVAGIIAACTDNATGVAGVAPDAIIIPVRVLDKRGAGTDEEVIAGINKAVDAGAHVINMSLGYGGISGTDWFDFPAFDQAIEAAAKEGVVIAAAAGNDSFPLCSYPALAKEIICVGATDARDNKSWYSTFANKEARGGPAVVAPGGTGTVFCDLDSEEILSLWALDKDETDPKKDCDGRPGYESVNGTSMATPHVAGVAALLYDRLGGERSPANAQKVIDAMTSTAVDLGPDGYDPIYGSGRVDALLAVCAVGVSCDGDIESSESPTTDPSESPTTDPSESPTSDPSESPTTEPSESPSPQPASADVSFTADSAQSGQYSDQTFFEARLRDSSSGEALGGKELTFELTGEASSRTFTATTNDDGVAAVSPTLDEKPGPHQLTVRFAGDQDHAGAADTVSFAVNKEDSALELSVHGEDDQKTLNARLSELDTSSQGLATRTINFYSDGQLIGTSQTDADGAASLPVPPRHRGANRTYKAAFDGDAFYARSSAQQPGKGKGGKGANASRSDGNGRASGEPARTYAGPLLVI